MLAKRCVGAITSTLAAPCVVPERRPGTARSARIEGVGVRLAMVAVAERSCRVLLAVEHVGAHRDRVHPYAPSSGCEIVFVSIDAGAMPILGGV